MLEEGAVISEAETPEKNAKVKWVSEGDVVAGKVSLPMSRLQRLLPPPPMPLKGRSVWSSMPPPPSSNLPRNGTITVFLDHGGVTWHSEVFYAVAKMLERRYRASHHSKVSFLVEAHFARRTGLLQFWTRHATDLTWRVLNGDGGNAELTYHNVAPCSNCPCRKTCDCDETKGAVQGCTSVLLFLSLPPSASLSSRSLNLPIISLSALSTFSFWNY